ncbi:MAG: hypothetical protein JNL11_01130 [Bdellovibrionaceae bacterium]|nr:hypothetical protein [Pseudobdellovibrionaceae bacterium]
MDNVTPNGNDVNGTTQKSATHGTTGFGISNRELAKQDNFQRYLTLTFDWMVANKVLIILFLGVVAFSSVGYVIYNQVKIDTQLKIQDQYYVIEKDYLKIKGDFEEADRQAKENAAKEAGKTKKDAKAAVEPKPEIKTPATGDLDKDYGTIVARFTELQKANPKSVPGKITSLVLADLYWEHKKFELAAQTLEKSLESTPKDLVDHLVLKKWSATQLSLGKFDDVIKKNQSVAQSTRYPFLTSYFKLQNGLAYEGLKQWEMAETQYKDVIAKGESVPAAMPNGEENERLKNHFGADQSAAELAQKYLLLLRLKKNSDQVGT